MAVPAIAPTPAPAPRRSHARDRAFFVGFAVLAAVLVFAGFARSYFLKGYFGAPALGGLVHLHGLVFTSWIVLLVVQAGLAIPLGDLLAFGPLVAAAFAYRHRPDAHKRLIAVATIAILPPAVARLPFAFILAVGPPAFFGLPDLLCVALMAHDVAARGRVHPATAWATGWLVATQVLRLAVAGTAAWLSFARWLTA